MSNKTRGASGRQPGLRDDSRNRRRRSVRRALVAARPRSGLGSSVRPRELRVPFGHRRGIVARTELRWRCGRTVALDRPERWEWELVSLE